MDRVYHTWDKWECYPAGFYETRPPDGISPDQAEELYRELLSDIPEFERVLALLTVEWPNSCEHYLTNENMNRIAWLGQAALAYKHHIPSQYRGGYHRLTPDQQLKADESALKALNSWLERRGEAAKTLDTARSKTQANLY